MRICVRVARMFLAVLAVALLMMGTAEDAWAKKLKDETPPALTDFAEVSLKKLMAFTADYHGKWVKVVVKLQMAPLDTAAPLAEMGGFGDASDYFFMVADAADYSTVCMGFFVPKENKDIVLKMLDIKAGDTMIIYGRAIDLSSIQSGVGGRSNLFVQVANVELQAAAGAPVAPSVPAPAAQ